LENTPPPGRYHSGEKYERGKSQGRKSERKRKKIKRKGSKR
jgi:hypothetical protein